MNSRDVVRVTDFKDIKIVNDLTEIIPLDQSRLWEVAWNDNFGTQENVLGNCFWVNKRWAIWNIVDSITCIGIKSDQYRWIHSSFHPVMKSHLGEWQDRMKNRLVFLHLWMNWCTGNLQFSKWLTICGEWENSFSILLRWLKFLFIFTTKQVSFPLRSTSSRFRLSFFGCVTNLSDGLKFQVLYLNCVWSTTIQPEGGWACQFHGQWSQNSSH